MARLTVTYDPRDIVIQLGDAIARELAKFVQCPRCNGAGKETLFMYSHVHTCEVCRGAKRVPEETAQREIERRDRERKRWL